MKQWIYPVMIIVAASSYGILSTIVKLAMKGGFSASEAITSQYVCGFIFVAIIYIVTQRRVPHFRGGKVLVLTGMLTATTGIVYGQALIYLPASLAVVMLFQFTWIGMLIECVAQRRLPKRIEVLSLVILFIGTIMAAGVINVDLSGIPWQGWVLGFLSGVSFAFFIFINSKPIEGMDSTTRLLFVATVALIMAAIFQSPEIVWNGTLFTEGLWIYGAALGLFGIVLPIYLFSVAVPHVGSGASSILGAMELPVAVLASVLVLHEPFTVIQFIGIIVIFTGMVLPSLFQNKIPLET
ncbi:DMT family transporter [Chungangia koreensis]|uniref:DMT family transporter n=1 Tax=Chungangia koreensis TaxID=752657 RepID=A0ABV8WZA7_9LACT